MAERQAACCSRCDKAAPDIARHKSWERTANENSLLEAMVASQHLQHEATEGADAGCKCFWLRGPPMANAYRCVPPPPEITDAAVQKRGLFPVEPGDWPLFGPYATAGAAACWAATDASGGPAAQSPRLRRCW